MNCSPHAFSDIAIKNDVFNYWRVGLRFENFPRKKWSNRTIHYVISPLYEPEDKITILTAIRTIAQTTCLKFPKWDGKAKDFLLIWPIKFPKVSFQNFSNIKLNHTNMLSIFLKGCWSFVGKVGGPQIISLQPPDEKGPNCLGMRD